LGLSLIMAKIARGLLRPVASNGTNDVFFFFFFFFFF